MAISLLKNAFCCGSLDDFRIPAVKTACKETNFGRTVYRITYPLRQLVSNLVMIPYTWTKLAVQATWKSLGDRCCVLIKIPLTLFAGAGALIVSLALGTTVSSTVGLIQSIHKSAREANLDELDTLLERVFWNKYDDKKTS